MRRDQGNIQRATRIIKSKSILQTECCWKSRMLFPVKRNSYSEGEKKKGTLILKEEFENLKTELIEEFRSMKRLFFTEVKVSKNESLQNYDKEIPAKPSERLMNSLEK